MSAPISAGRWAKASSSMVASLAPGTAGSTCPRTVNRRPRFRNESPLSVSASRTDACSWIPGRYRQARRYSPPALRNLLMSQSSQAQRDPQAADRDAFFIGWEPTPKKYARFLRPIIVALLLVTGGVAAAVAYLQRDPGTGHWDTDNVRTFDGIVYTQPYAMIRVPGDKPGDPPRTMLLVEDGKFGALPRVEEFVHGKADGVAVRVTGTILHRDGRWMLELSEGEKGMRRLMAAEEARLPPLGWPAAEVLGENVTL